MSRVVGIVVVGIILMWVASRELQRGRVAGRMLNTVPACIQQLPPPYPLLCKRRLVASLLAWKPYVVIERYLETSWPAIQSKVTAFCQTQDTLPDVLVALETGGVFVAALLQQSWEQSTGTKIPLVIMCVRKDKSNRSTHPIGDRFHDPLKTEAAMLACRGKSAVVVDDVVSSGKTIRLVCELIPEVKYAISYCAVPLARTPVKLFVISPFKSTPFDLSLK